MGEPEFPVVCNVRASVSLAIFSSIRFLRNVVLGAVTQTKLYVGIAVGTHVCRFVYVMLRCV